MKPAPLHEWKGCPECVFIGSADDRDVYGCGINDVRPFYYHIVERSGQVPSVLSSELESSEWRNLIAGANGYDDPSVSPNAHKKA